MTILQQLKQQAADQGKSEEFLDALETVFNRFSDMKQSVDFTEAFQQDMMTFAAMMQETEGETSEK